MKTFLYGVETFHYVKIFTISSQIQKTVFDHITKHREKSIRRAVEHFRRKSTTRLGERMALLKDRQLAF